MRAHIEGIGDFDVIKASYDENQNEVGQLNFDIAAVDVENPDLLVFRDVSLSHLTYTVNGIMVEDVEPDINEGQVILRCRCYTNLGRLTCAAANTAAFFQDVELTVIIQALLNSTTNWVLNDTSTMLIPTARTTIDLRSGKEVLFAQVSEAIKSIPNLAMRYAGYNSLTGNHQLDIGNFAAKRWYAIQDDNLIKIESAASNRKPIKRIQAYSDKSGDSRVTLGDALAYPGILTHPDYASFPIVNIGGNYFVEDASISAGCELSKNYSIHKTKNDSVPTNPQISEVGFAVWQAAIRDLQKNRRHRTFTVTARFDDIPALSDRILIRATIRETIYDSVAQRERIVRTLDVNDWYRIVSLKTDFQSFDDGEIVMTISATDQDYVETTDPDVELYSALERHDTADKNVVSVFGSGIKGQNTVEVTHDPGVDPPDGSCTGTAKNFTFPLGVIPVGTTGVFVTISSFSPGAITMVRVQEPAVPGTPFILCVQTPGGGWSGSPVTIAVTYLFY